MQITHGIIFIATLFIINAYKIGDYCSEKAKCGNNDNIVCKRKDEQCKIAKNCKGGGKSDLSVMSDADRQLVIDVHNELREKCASGAESRGGGMPKASNMEAFSYDLELEFSAQCSANSCEYGHDACTKTAKYNGVGQNLHQIVNKALDMKGAITEWYDEVAIHTKKQKYDQEKQTDIGHFTQVIHAKTNKVGCGKTVYGEASTTTSYFVCDYFPGGNTGTDMYWVGDPQSKCDKGVKNDKYKSLCGKIVESSKFEPPFEGGSDSSEDRTPDRTTDRTNDTARSSAAINFGNRPVILALLVLIDYHLFKTLLP